MLARRNLIQLLGSAPAAIVGAKSVLTDMMASPAVATALALGSVAGEPEHPPGFNRTGLPNFVFKQMTQAREHLEDEKWIRNAARAGNFDADISALRSVSKVNKYRMQVERDIGTESLLRYSQRFLWQE